VSTLKTFTRRALAGASLLPLALLAAGCDGGGGGATGMEVPTTGSLQVSGLFSSSGAPLCSDHSTWTYDIVTPDPNATAGTISRVVHTKNDDHVVPQNGVCRSTDSVFGLRLGTWRATWSGGRQCVVDLKSTMWLTIETNGNCRTTI
jgi:hypothetical protein